MERMKLASWRKLSVWTVGRVRHFAHHQTHGSWAGEGTVCSWINYREPRAENRAAWSTKQKALVVWTRRNQSSGLCIDRAPPSASADKISLKTVHLSRLLQRRDHIKQPLGSWWLLSFVGQLAAWGNYWHWLFNYAVDGIAVFLSASVWMSVRGRW